MNLHVLIKPIFKKDVFNPIKLYNILLLTTTFLIIFNWIYEKYLYEITYVQYLPNYDKEVVFPNYSPGNPTPIYPEGVSKDKIAKDSFSYIPFHGKMLYYLSGYTIIFDPFLFLIAFIWGLIIFFQKKKYKEYKWWVTQVVLFAIMFFFIVNTEIMD